MPELLKKGAEHYGFRGAVWTRARVGKVIENVFGVSYSDGHVGQILAQIGWTRQKPSGRASERDEEAIDRNVARAALARAKKKPIERTEPSYL